MKRLPFLLAALLALPLAAGCSDPLVGPDAAPGTLASDGSAYARLPGADHGGRLLSTTLTGEAEVPGPGDPDGSGTASLTFNVGRQEVCFALTVEDIEPATASHIHEAPAGVAGPVVVTLVPPTDGSSSGCVADVDRALIQDILRDPAGYYVNVHNAEYPSGAVRGQLGE